MARRAEYLRFEVPRGVVLTVTSIIGDYDRRARILGGGNAPEEVLARYREYNTAVENAASEIEVGLRPVLLRDIAEGRGWSRSHAVCLCSKNAYYRRRKKLIHDIARELSLIWE